ncbi:MAG: FGGY family carbohydrate kinase [Candidatus Omnitrophica bacterium]|nr:FGGY family carbohydrate kinase [Candidatus Omnitrophota bacterium]
MKKEKKYLAIDIGASNGKAVCGVLRNGKFELNEVYRFPNEPVYINNSLRWNIVSLWKEVQNCISACRAEGFDDISSIGIDTWGVDFVLLDKNRQILQIPYHYRDNLTKGVEKIISKKINEEKLYTITGLFINKVTSLSQMVSLKEKSKWILDIADVFLMMPDFFRYLLSGNIGCELTVASSSQLLDIREKKWSEKVFDTFNLPIRIMPEIIQPGTICGKMYKQFSDEYSLKDVNIVATAGHDTASAAAAVPFVSEDTLFISSGTWIVFGLISNSVKTDEETYKSGFINEAGFNSVLIVRNLAGLYLFENFYRQLLEKNKKLTYRDIISSAASTKGFKFFINPNDSIFFLTENVESAVREYCLKTEQKYSENPADIFRTILEGIAISFIKPKEDLERYMKKAFNKICMVGGGVRNNLLSQMIADATGLDVITGHAEATSLGNLCIQAFADGEIKDISKIRDIAANSCKMRVFHPGNTEKWLKHFEKFRNLL